MADRSKNIFNKISVRIKSMRTNCGYTQKELAEMLYKSESTVRMWELGKSEPDLETLFNLSQIFGVSVDYLLGKGTNEYAHTQNEKPSENGELPDKNVVITIGRDGTYSKKRLTDEQIKALQAIIDQMPDAPDEI